MLNAEILSVTLLFTDLLGEGRRLGISGNRRAGTEQYGGIEVSTVVFDEFHCRVVSVFFWSALHAV
jgi:hypothetical protein